MGDDLTRDILGFLDRRPRRHGHDDTVWSSEAPRDPAAPRYLPPIGSSSSMAASSRGWQDQETTAYTASTTIRTYPQTSVFSGEYPASEASWAPSTAPSHGHRQQTFAEQFANSIELAPEPTPLWCEFRDLYNCHAMFRSDDEAAWVRHHRQHLGDELPHQLMCWFCDDFVAHRTSGRRANFDNRMRHIADHIRRDGLVAGSMRPDFFMVTHLHDIKLLDDQGYDFAMEYTE